MGLSIVQIREAVRAEIAAQMQTTANKLSSGKARDYPEYREGVGKITGGRDAMDAVDSVFNKLINDEED